MTRRSGSPIGEPQLGVRLLEAAAARLVDDRRSRSPGDVHGRADRDDHAGRPHPPPRRGGGRIR